MILYDDPSWVTVLEQDGLTVALTSVWISDDSDRLDPVRDHLASLELIHEEIVEGQGDVSRLARVRFYQEPSQRGHGQPVPLVS